MNKPIYLTASGSHLPGEPVSNNCVLEHIGKIDDRSERLGRLVLRQNGIKTRHYAWMPDGSKLANNAQMAARAIEDAINMTGHDLAEIDFLATSTTQGDLLVPGHASAVHAELQLPPLEIANFQSVCASSVMALKTAWLQIAAGDKRLAAISGSEFSSRFFQPGFYSHAPDVIKDDRARMNAEFLRWTLSDGGGAVLLEGSLPAKGPAFSVDWVDLISLANRFEPCMFAGVRMSETDDPNASWSHFGDPVAAAEHGAIMLLQDFDLLKRIIRSWVTHYLEKVERGRIVPDEVDWLLCHYSAKSLREEIISLLKGTGGMIDEEKWFSNLSTRGNTGSASIFVMIDEFLRSNKAKPGDKVLCIVPESGRAMVGFIMLTCVQ